MAERNYTLGRGKVFFSRFTSGETPGAFRYLGNTPELNLTIETEDLEHVSSEAGVREVDDTVALDVTRTGSMICDDIQLDNLALFFFGSKSTVAIAAAMNQVYDIDGAIPDGVYVPGLTDSNRVGARGLSNVALTDKMFDRAGGNDYATFAGTKYTENTHYRVDLANGILEILPGSTAGFVPAAGADIRLTYDLVAASYPRVISGSTPIEGALRFAEDNPKGDNSLWVFPKLTLQPNGDVALKGDEWRQVPFTLNLQKPSSGEAIYINGVPVV